MIVQNQLQKWAKKAERNTTYHRGHGLHQSHRRSPGERCTEPGGSCSCRPGTGTAPDGRSGVGTGPAHQNHQSSLSVHHISTIWGYTCTERGKSGETHHWAIDQAMSTRRNDAEFQVVWGGDKWNYVFRKKHGYLPE